MDIDINTGSKFSGRLTLSNIITIKNSPKWAKFLIKKLKKVKFDKWNDINTKQAITFVSGTLFGVLLSYIIWLLVKML